MKLTGYIAGAGYDRNGKRQITLTVNEDCFEELDTLTEKVLNIDISEKQKKRSLTANAYMWALCTDIANAMGDVSKDDVYRQAIVERGIYKDFHYLTESELKTLTAAWQLLGTGWIAQPLDYEADGEHRILRCYYGTSRYSAKRIQKVIEWLEEDARTLGLTIMSRQEASLLLTEWDKQQRKEKTE